MYACSSVTYSMVHERVEVLDCDLFNQLWVGHQHTSVSTHVVAGEWYMETQLEVEYFVNFACQSWRGHD